jgi:hypothetical protein
MTQSNEARSPGKAGGMSNDPGGAGRGPDEPGGGGQEADVAEYQSELDATSANGDDGDEDNKSGEAAGWADRHPRAAGAVGDPGDEPAGH